MRPGLVSVGESMHILIEEGQTMAQMPTDKLIQDSYAAAKQRYAMLGVDGFLSSQSPP